MRRLVGVLGISAALMTGAAGAADATEPAWIGPYPTLAQCETSEAGFQAAGHLTGGCVYRDLAHSWQDGYYFHAWPVD
ncbi:hypothetical protein LZG04_21425 [Saccharothrix sp. S26]|uniref:hypothetical protein n=1 Tax=Saccharothrix sp. S26 TaxID=2907215 RepID=UPI001F34D0EC|nr:hypothetical protein [Saccharothrix sp. S26]MCE6997344.1 hypothetical protein [Saccharothrix sp. S26]